MIDWAETLGWGEQGWGPALLLATLLTLALTAAGVAVGSVIGGGVAAARLSSARGWRVAGEAYAAVFRGIPELLVIYLFYFGGSAAVTAVGQWFGAEGFIATPPFLVGALAVGMISGAYQGEVYRGAFLAVARGEIEAARAIGMPPAMLLRRILLPQIFRYALPGLGNVWQMGLKDSALISVTGLAELMRTTQTAAGATHEPFMFYAIGGALYLVITGVSNQAFGRAEVRLSRASRPRVAPASAPPPPPPPVHAAAPVPACEGAHSRDAA